MGEGRQLIDKKIPGNNKGFDEKKSECCDKWSLNFFTIKYLLQLNLYFLFAKSLRRTTVGPQTEDLRSLVYKDSKVKYLKLGLLLNV